MGRVRPFPLVRLVYFGALLDRSQGPGTDESLQRMWFGFSQGWAELREVTDHIDGYWWHGISRWTIDGYWDIPGMSIKFSFNWTKVEKKGGLCTTTFSLQFLKEVSFGKLTLFSNETINVYGIFLYISRINASFLLQGNFISWIDFGQKPGTTMFF